MSPSKKYAHPNLWMLSQLEKGLYRCDYDVVKNPEMRRLSRWVLHAFTSVLLERQKDTRHTGRRGEGRATMEAEVGEMQPQVKECWQPPEARRGREETVS